MAKPRFRQAVEEVARPMLEPLGFKFEKVDEPGSGAYSFLRPWQAGWNQGIALQTSLRGRGFAVEIGIVKSNFWQSPHSEMGPWRKYGLRRRLGSIVRPDVQSDERDFVPYTDQENLEEALRRELLLALECAPTEWELMGNRLLGRA